MDKKIRHIDKKLDNYLDELHQAIQAENARALYGDGRILLEYLLNNLGRKNKLKSFGFFGRGLTIFKCLEDKELTDILVFNGIKISDCEMIKNAGNDADHPNFESETDELPYNLNEIKTYISLLLTVCDKIAKTIYGLEIDLNNSCSSFSTLLEMQSLTLNVDDDDIDYDSLDEDLLDDPVQRLPICFCLDLSGSMRKYNKFEYLKEALKIFSESILSDAKARDSAEVAVIAFNDECKVIRDFSRLKETITISDVVPKNQTLISNAINKALQLLDSRKKEYFQTGVEYYQPWLVIISDGLPGDDCTDVKKKILELEANRKLTVFSIPIIPSQIEGAKKKAVTEFMDGFSSQKSQPVDSEKISELFRWFSKSASMSVRADDQYTTKIDSNKNWKV